MRYIVLMNRCYMNSFRYYSAAANFAEELRRKFKNSIVEITEYRKWE